MPLRVKIVGSAITIKEQSRRETKNQYQKRSKKDKIVITLQEAIEKSLILW